MPRPTTFDSGQEYYSTLFHELTHSTGHPSRLDRDSVRVTARFGSHEYSKEELIAEMGVG
jgi:antirestriction protein ArdC